MLMIASGFQLATRQILFLVFDFILGIRVIMRFSDKLGKSGNFGYTLFQAHVSLTKKRNTLMRMRVVWGLCCLPLLLWLGACSKSGQTDQLPALEIEGIKLDTPQLVTEFMNNASPELYKKVNDAVTDIRYQSYVESMMALDEVLKGPGLNDKQKKLLSQVIGQLKEVIAKVPPRSNR